MTFKKKELKNKYIGILDIGSYKIKFGICEINNDKLEIVGYSEKRQNSGDIGSDGFNNIEGICEAINLCIINAEKSSNINVEDIIINFPFFDIFFTQKKINFVRKEPDKEIAKEELKEIVKKIEIISIGSSIKDIEAKSGYLKSSLKLIISNVSGIKLDKVKTSYLLGSKTKEINMNILNIFIPISKYEQISYIGDILNKNILQIIPSEFGTTYFFKNEDLVILDIGSSTTSLTIKKDKNILGVNKFSLGINDLVEIIQEKNKLPQIEIINKIDTDKWEEEKKEFLAILKDYIVIGINDIIIDGICPSKFFIIGGGSNNFIKDSIKFDMKFNRELRILKNIEILEYENGNNIFSKSNLSILSMIKAYEKLLKKEDDLITISIKEAIEEEGL